MPCRWGSKAMVVVGCVGVGEWRHRRVRRHGRRRRTGCCPGRSPDLDHDGVAAVRLGEDLLSRAEVSYGQSSHSGTSGGTAMFNSASCSCASTISAGRRVAQIGSPIPRTGRPGPLYRSVKSRQAGMISAGLCPRSAMSANTTRSASSPSADRSARNRGSATATITGSCRASPSRTNGTTASRNPPVPGVQHALVPVRPVGLARAGLARFQPPAHIAGYSAARSAGVHRTRPSSDPRVPVPVQRELVPRTAGGGGVDPSARGGIDHPQVAVAGRDERMGMRHHQLDERQRSSQPMIRGDVRENLIQHTLITRTGENAPATGYDVAARESLQ